MDRRPCPGAPAGRTEYRRGVNDREPTGLAHVATVSFLASRLVPSIGFWIALMGGASLARSAERDGARWGYGASIAAMLQTVAIMGPLRFAVPLTQAMSAPLLGRFHARGTSAPRQFLVCAAIRLAQTGIGTAFFVLVLSGGIDTYTGTYDAIASRMPLLPEGRTAALILTGVSLLAWAAFASTVQVLSYRRALNNWETPDRRSTQEHPPDSGEDESDRRTYDPRAIAVAAAVAFALLVASTQWLLLAGVAGFLVIAWATARGDQSVARAGLTLAAFLAIGVFVFTLIGGISVDAALRRGARAGLLALVATWLRVAAGTPGLREVSRRSLGRLRRIPSLPEAARVMDRLDSDRQMWASARSALETFDAANKRPIQLLDASLAWAEREAAGFKPLPPVQRQQLSVRLRDGLLVVLAVAPMVVIVLH